jgi:hypothetical protein
MRPDPLPSPLSLGPFRVGEALALGVSEKRLLGDDLEVPFHGLRAPTRLQGLPDRCHAALPALRPGVLFSHVTAAALWGLPLPLGAADGDLHVVGPVAERRRRAGLVVHAQSSPATGAFTDGLPIVQPAWAWAQCSELLPLDALIAAGDALCGRWSSHPSAREQPREVLDAVVSTWAGRRGARRLREALDLVRANVWSPKETELRLLLVRAGLPEPSGLNAAITDAAGRVLGHGDLVWQRQRLVVEYEGDQHRTDRRQWRSDVAKYERYGDAGWRVVRVTDDDLVTPRILVARITRHLGSERLR